MITQKKHYLERGAGILMPISALPSPHGIGTLGEKSYYFVDFLSRIGCCYWQVLPVGPTSYGDSPYQSFSAFAGNPYYIDLDFLVEEGLLQEKEYTCFEWQEEEAAVNYEALYKYRFTVLKTAFQRSQHKAAKDYMEFCKDNEYWLEDYSFYMAVKECFQNHEWLLWDEDIKNRREEAVCRYQILLKENIDFWKFCQFKFRQQWDRLKKYANDKNIHIIGDIPLYVSMDSSDVWAHGALFELDENKKPINVAGVPPDAFSDLGQRWGNPLYQWDNIEKEDFKWWRERMKISASLYDIIRIDHFIGIVNYYSIPSYCPTAVKGQWIAGPGSKLTDVIRESAGDAKIIAEDLGLLTPKVRELIESTGYPGMKILEFGINGPADQEYLPHNFTGTNIIAYTGTHDNETLYGFIKNKEKSQLEFAYKYFNVRRKKDLVYAAIRTLYASIADVVIVQMQDLLLLDNKARMNFPATLGGNWRWRMKEEQYHELNEDNLLELAYIFNRT